MYLDIPTLNLVISTSLSKCRYPQARLIIRKIIFHSGPTNSGKTYQALEKFMSSKSGVYCGPLKLLASEVYHKANEKVSIALD